MIISLNWLKKYTDIDVTVDELAALIGERLVEIEGVIDLGAKYKDVLVAKVIEAAPLENSDHLNVTKLDDGGVWTDVERDENGYIQVVCGAPNVRAGLLVAWLPPRSIVPETFESEEPFVLGARALRGVMSNGMIASARELALYDDHEGILEIDKDATPGASFAELYELNDYLFDIENKSLTHRPDAFGVIGFAREIAGIQGKAFITPEWLNNLAPRINNNGSMPAPGVVIEDLALSARFTAIALTDINEASTSPIQLQTYLARSGVRPINASVDVSNYLMLLTGQPSHTYDYDKLKRLAGDDFTIRVRSARAGEKLTLLDSREIELDESDIVIAAGETAIGLAGIMGGESTKVDDTTKAVILEVATFDLYHMRSSQMRHGIFSEAVTRFTKGVPAPLAAPVAAEAVRMLGEHAGGVAVSGIVEDYPGVREVRALTVTSKHVNKVLGTQFAAEDIVALLENVGFTVVFNEPEAKVTVPYWREDIHIPEDVIEEVGRLAGFDTINPTLPGREAVAVRPSTFDVLRARLRRRLARAGANEVLSYSFVHGDDFKRVGQDPANAYRIVNSISPELQYYRQSLVPSLLANIHSNVKAGFDAFALFELNKTHQKQSGVTEEGVPIENDSLGLVLTDTKQSGAAYYQAKHLLEYMLGEFGLTARYEVLSGSDAALQPFEPKRSATVILVETGEICGVIGEFKRSVGRAHKLPAYSAGFEINPRILEPFANQSGSPYQPLSRYPGTERDICFRVSGSNTYAQVVSAAREALTAVPYSTEVLPVDIYRGAGEEKKNITIRVRLVSYDKTLTNDEVHAVINGVSGFVRQKTQGEVV